MKIKIQQLKDTKEKWITKGKEAKDTDLVFMLSDKRTPMVVPFTIRREDIQAHKWVEFLLNKSIKEIEKSIN